MTELIKRIACWIQGCLKLVVSQRRGEWLAALLFVSAVSNTTFAGVAESPSALSRTNLLVFHNKRGEVLRVRTTQEWEQRKAEIVKAMETIMGPLPGKEKRCDLEPKVESEKDRGDYLERAVTYSSEPGARVRAYLLVPNRALKNKTRVPAVLALHPTDMEFGNRVVVDELRTTYRAYGRDLVHRGYVVIAPPYPLMADYQPDLKALGYRSGTMKAVWDNIRALDFLESLPFVDKNKFGAIGHSLGGHNAIYTAVFEPRLKVVVSSCGFDSYRDYKNGDITGWTQERYMPALATYKNRLEEIPFDFYEMIGALAPRPIFINAPVGDSNFKAESVDRIVADAKLVYALEGGAEKLKVIHPNCGHEFPAEAREEAYRFIDAQLQ